MIRLASVSSSGIWISICPMAVPPTSLVSAYIIFTGTLQARTRLEITGSEDSRPSNMIRSCRSFPRATCLAASPKISCRPMAVFGLEKISDTLPASAIWLWSMMATRSQIASITVISWVMTITVTPISRLIFLRSSRICLVVLGSRALVASSHKSTLGLVAMARAIATRCFCPPESCAG